MLSGFVLKDRQHGICVVLLIYPDGPGLDHKLINIHSVWCINLPENTTITISLKICDGNRFSLSVVISVCLPVSVSAQGFLFLQVTNHIPFHLLQTLLQQIFPGNFPDSFPLPL